MTHTVTAIDSKLRAQYKYFGKSKQLQSSSGIQRARQNNCHIKKHCNCFFRKEEFNSSDAVELDALSIDMQREMVKCAGRHIQNPTIYL